MAASTNSSEFPAALVIDSMTISPAHWREGDRLRVAGPTVTLFDEFIRVTELRKTVEAMRAPMIAVGANRNRTAPLMQRTGVPARYQSMRFVSVG